MWYSRRSRAQSHITILAPCNSIRTHMKLNLRCISANVIVFASKHSKDLAAVYAVGTKKFSVVTFCQKH
jgi:hypothetical protein